MHFHDLRHEADSRLVEAGLGDQEVAAISSHKSMQMLKRYTHLPAEDLVERLDRLIGRTSTSHFRGTRHVRSHIVILWCTYHIAGLSSSHHDILHLSF